MIKPITLKNGLRVLRFPKSESQVTTIGFVVNSGLAVEEGYFPEGINQLVERLLWCGTDKYQSGRQLNLTLESLGGSLTSLVGYEFNQMYLTVPSYNQYKAVSLLADVIQHSQFDPREIDREKKLLQDKLYGRENQLQDDEGKNIILSHFYLNQRLEQPYQIALETILNIQQEDVLEYLDHQYRPDQSFLVVAGGFEDKGIMDLIEQEWGHWNPKSKRFVEPHEVQGIDAIELPKIIYRQRGTFQTQLSFGFQAKPMVRSYTTNEDTGEPLTSAEIKKKTPEFLSEQAKLLLLNTILGQGLSSRLWTKSVEEEMLFSNIISEVVTLKNLNYLEINGKTENNQFSFGLESVLAVLESLKKTTVSINELSKSKELLKGKLILEHENLLIQSIWQVDQYITTGLNYDLEDILSVVSKIQAAEIRTLASDIFTPQNMLLVIIGTAKETRLVDRLVAKYLG